METLAEKLLNLQSVNRQYASQILKSGEELDKTKKHNSDLFHTVERYRNEAAMLRRQLVKAQGRWQRQQRHVHMLHARVDTLQSIVDACAGIVRTTKGNLTPEQVNFITGGRGLPKVLTTENGPNTTVKLDKQPAVDACQGNSAMLKDPAIRNKLIDAVTKPTLSAMPLNKALEIAQRLQVDPVLRSAVMYLIKN